MCRSPINIHDQPVKCGQCIPCLIEKSQDWARRCEYENKDASSGAFVTLTYNDESALWIDNQEGTFTTLHKPDLIRYIKTLREYEYRDRKTKEIDNRAPIRFFSNGEYGPETFRAHYHLLLWNFLFRENIFKAWANKGHVSVKPINSKRIRYVTNYMMTKDQSCLEGQSKPFMHMSRNPGIGNNYIEANQEYHARTGDYKLRNKDASRMPRYYSDRLLSEEHRDRALFEKKQKFDKFIQETHEKFKNMPDPFLAQRLEEQIQDNSRRNRVVKKRKL